MDNEKKRRPRIVKPSDNPLEERQTNNEGGDFSENEPNFERNNRPENDRDQPFAKRPDFGRDERPSFERKPWQDRSQDGGGYERKPWQDRSQDGGGNYERRPYQDRNQGGGGYERKPWQDRSQDSGGGNYERRPYQDRNQGGGGYERKPWQDRNQDSGGGNYERRPYQDRNQGGGGYERKPWQDRSQDSGGGNYERRPYQDRNQGGGGYERKPWQDRSQDSGGGNYERRPYQDRNQGGGGYERKPWQDRSQDSGGGNYERRPYQDRNQGGGGYERKPWQDRSQDSGGGNYERRPYQDRNQGGGGYERKPWQDRSHDGGGGNYERRPYQDRNQGGGGYERRPYQDRGGYGNKPFGQKSFGNKPYGKRPMFKKQEDFHVEILPKAELPSGEGMPLNKFLAHCGVASRRKAVEFIEQGLVTVNGQVVKEPYYRYQIGDAVICDGKPLAIQERQVYLLLNKPKGVITTTDDEHGRATVLDIVDPHVPERIYPVGRLDRDTTGLLLLTNDGELAQKLTHPSHHVQKQYRVGVSHPVGQRDMDKIAEGFDLDDGPVRVNWIRYAEDHPGRDVVELEITEGRNRIVRRLFEALGYDVRKLDRFYFAGLTKKDLARGQFRDLTQREIIMLKHFTGHPSTAKPAFTNAGDDDLDADSADDFDDMEQDN